MSKKTSFLILGIILVIVIFIFLLSLFRIGSESTFYIPKTPEAKKEVVLKLEPAKGTYPVGDIFSIDILLDIKNKKTAGTDIILKYNPTILEAIEIKKDSVFENWVLTAIEKEKGEIRISALAAPTKGFIGKGKIGTIDFKGLQKGETDVVFDFQKGSTTATNLAELGTGQNLLEKVINGHYTIY